VVMVAQEITLKTADSHPAQAQPIAIYAALDPANTSAKLHASQAAGWRPKHMEPEIKSTYTGQQTFIRTNAAISSLLRRTISEDLIAWYNSETVRLPKRLIITVRNVVGTD